MPANLPPTYHEAEERYRAAKSPDDKIAALEEMLRIIPKHKGTDHLQADIKAKIKELTEELAGMPVGEWRTLRIRLRCLEAAGADMTLAAMRWPAGTPKAM